MCFSTLCIYRPYCRHGLTQEPIVPVAEKSATALWGPASGQFCRGAALSLHCRSRQRHDVGRSSCVLGDGAGWHHQSLARTAHPQTGVPARAIMLQTLWASVLILSGTFEQLLVYSGIVSGVLHGLTLSSIFPLRSRLSEDCRSTVSRYIRSCRQYSSSAHWRSCARVCFSGPSRLCMEW